MKLEPRGIRNNNPLNIRHNPKNKWAGMSKKQTDKAFVQFKDMKWGIRAAFRILLNYVKNGFDTPRKIIRRWAPPKENNTEGYINSVAMLLNGERSMDEKVQTMMDYCLLARAMAWVETGRFLPFELFDQAWDLLWDEGLPVVAEGQESRV